MSDACSETRELDLERGEVVPLPADRLAEARRVAEEADRRRREEAEAEAARAIVPDLLPGGRLLDTDYPPVEFAVDPIAPRRKLVEWVGAHGIFKSTLAIAACLCIASGRRFGGLPAQRGRAVFITAEDDEPTLARRVLAWLESVPVGQDRREASRAIRDSFAYLTCENVRGLALTLVDHGEPAARAAVVARLTALVRGTAFVVLETAARLAEGDENANRVQATFAQVLEQIAIDSGAAVVIVRHVSKAGARAGAKDSYAGRGGGALSDAARSVVNFTRPGEKDDDDDTDPMRPVVMTHAKATLSRPARRITWLPVETTHGVYLRALDAGEEIRADAAKLLDAFPPGGLTVTDLKDNKRAAGLSRRRAKAAMALLLEIGTVVEAVEDRERNKGVTVYRRVGEGS